MIAEILYTPEGSVKVITRLMAVYWGITAAIISGLLANAAEPGQALAFSATAVITITVLSSLLAAWFITRQSNIRFLRLFARTLL
jgi:hypothetical protein